MIKLMFAPGWKAVALASAALMLTSCSALLPMEEELPQAPVVHSYEIQQYVQTVVTRGDLVKSTKVRCTYKPAREETLRFTIGGEYIDTVYVKEGDSVQAGALIAELAQGDLPDQILKQKNGLEKLEMEAAHAKETFELDDKEQELLLIKIRQDGWSSPPEDPTREEREFMAKLRQTEVNQIKEREQLKLDYEAKVKKLEETMELEQKKLEELEKKLNSRQLRAEIGGTITYLRDIEKNRRSVEGESFAVISDMSSSVFIAEGEDCQHFQIGGQVEISSSGKTMQARTISISPAAVVDGKEVKAKAYFQLEQPDPELEDGDVGSITVILEEHQDTLYVPAKAVKTANGEKIVYYLNEEGLRAMKSVETGMEADEMIEIVSGLSEGEKIVLQ